MTPTEHYREAERRLSLAVQANGKDLADWHVSLAQVHATLATCAMTAGTWAPQEDRPAAERVERARTDGLSPVARELAWPSQ